jgi:DNA-binding NarL/FixJ family response regulator
MSSSNRLWDANHMKLLLVDYAATRLGVRAALDGEWDTFLEAETATEAIQLAGREQPTLCLVGLEIPGGGIKAIRGISEVAPGAAVVVLAASHDPEDFLEAIRVGAVGYVHGISAAGELRRVVRAVASGEAAVPRGIVLDLIRELQRSNGADELSTREMQVLSMLRRGHGTSAIAARLGISPVTVRRHISSLVQKTGAADREELIRQGGSETGGRDALPASRTANELNASGANRLIA